MLARNTFLRTVAIVTAALLCSGCVFATSPNNWIPQDTTVYQSYNTCFQQAQYGYSQSYAGASWNYGGNASAGASSGVATNVASLKSCMQAAGYQKREPTTTEVA